MNLKLVKKNKKFSLFYYLGPFFYLKDETSGRETLTPLFKTQPDGFEHEFEDLDNISEHKSSNNKKLSQNQSVTSSVSSLDGENLKGSASSLTKYRRYLKNY